MNKRNDNKTSQAKDLRVWLIRAIWSLGGVTLFGIVVGVILLFNISKISGWSAENRQEERQEEVYSKEQIDKFIISVLIAVQNQPLGQDNAQADMVFIASFNAFEQRLTTVALASETLVEVEWHGRKTLGEAYALGGPGLLVNTINQNFELDLQSYACTDTHSLAAMIDLLGGIQIELTPSEAGYINDALEDHTQSLQAGPVTLTGVESMVHAMDNLSDQEPLGSLSRSLALIQSATLNMRKTATKEAMLPLLSLVFSNIQTNLDFAALNDWGYEILKAEEIEYRSLILPCEDSWKAVEGKDKALQADISRNGALLRETLYNAQ